MYNDEPKTKYFNTGEFFTKFFSILGAIVITITVGVFGYGAIKAFFASGEISYCYTTIDSSSYGVKVVNLNGFRDWCPDRIIGVYTSETEALDMAKKINCRIGTKQ